MSYSKQYPHHSPKNIYDYKTNYQTTIKAVGGKWYIGKDEFKANPYQEKAFEKKGTNQRRKN